MFQFDYTKNIYNVLTSDFFINLFLCRKVMSAQLGKFALYVADRQTTMMKTISPR